VACLKNINIPALRYIVQVDKVKSINLAAQQLYISHSTLSRTIKNLEEEIGITLFCRTSRGVETTHDGRKFIQEAGSLLSSIDAFETRFFNSQNIVEDTLMVATQRCTTAANCFLELFEKNGAQNSRQNFAILEESFDGVLDLICSGVCGVGVVTCSSDQRHSLLKRLEKFGLDWSLLDESPVSVQIRRDHPLASRSTITISDLSPFTHLVFLDESVTNINYCSDVTQFNEFVFQKRIVVKERGTLRQLLNNTDVYYIGADLSRFCFHSETDPVYIHLEDVDFKLDTYWIKQSNHTLTSMEQKYVAQLTSYFYV
jgi:DNA-binding transcriptional LysR family regulator